MGFLSTWVYEQAHKGISIALEYLDPFSSELVTIEDEVINAETIKRVPWEGYGNLDQSQYYVEPLAVQSKDTILTSLFIDTNSKYFKKIAERAYRGHEIAEAHGWDKEVVKREALIHTGWMTKAIAEAGHESS